LSVSLRSSLWKIFDFYVSTVSTLEFFFFPSNLLFSSSGELTVLLRAFQFFVDGGSMAMVYGDALFICLLHLSLFVLRRVRRWL